MNSCPSTGQFSVPASVYVRAVARRRLWGVVWLPCLLLAAAAIAGCFDSRFWFLGLLLLFIIYPMALSLTWLSLAARPAMRWLLRPQEVSFHPDGITVEFYGYEEDAPPAGTFRLTSDDIRETEQSGKYVTLFLNQNKFDIDFLLIPAENLPQGVNFSELIKE